MILGYCSIFYPEPVARLEAQERNLRAIGAQKIFSDRLTGLNSRSDLERAIEAALEGDVLAVTKPYRVARSSRALFALINRLGGKGVGFRIINTPLDTSTTTGRMVLGSTPRWSLGISPLRSVLWDSSLGWLTRR